MIHNLNPNESAVSNRLDASESKKTNHDSSLSIHAVRVPKSQSHTHTLSIYTRNDYLPGHLAHVVLLHVFLQIVKPVAALLAEVALEGQ